ncbi:TAXI family TRAP transporter solute-binding subunit [Terasakiella sp. A23]|uniref:TAXI family TRAP transporter solute-binding subunit n=1 Tax=Terasakiella sp. FCG-A23 TaxID=3080561 RepID=UPI002952C5B8|nr:TAXI family TRAP transporter solute-binding subunit [Terasakiella sp. A23]MDV7341534.1 TAXI family TRAP transporter solute-binding subunit [Terasakiella sp. A23]
MFKTILRLSLLSLLFFPTYSMAETITIATGGKSGVYYPIGQAICDLINKDTASHKTDCRVISTGGSIENVLGLDDKKYDFALVQSDVQMYALNGVKTFRDRSSMVSLRSLLSLHSEPLHLMVAKNSGIKSFDGLKGKTVNLGNAESGSRALADLILKEKGWKHDKFAAVTDRSSKDQIQALCDGKDDAAFWVAGLANQAMTDVAKNCGVRLISITGEWVRILLLDNPQYVATRIPAKTYPNMTSKVSTFGPKASLLTHADLKKDKANLVMKTVFENLETLKKAHPALAQLKPKEMVEDGVIAPFHSGAMAYILEKGLLR